MKGDGIDYSITLMMNTTMNHLLTLGLLLLLSTTSTWSQDTWVKVIGGKGVEGGNSITRTSDGGILITGTTSSNDGDFEGMRKGRYDIFVIKLDTNGDVLWKKTFGGSSFDVGYSITTTSDDGILITGHTNSNDGDFKGMNKGDGDIFVIKLDRDGNVLWKKTFGGSNWDVGQSITTSPDGGILITGETYSNDGDFKGMNKGEDDIFVVKLDKDGNLLWKKTFGGSDRDVGHSITTTSDGGVLITGYTQSNDGDFEGMNKGGSEDIFVMKLDKDGNLLWKKTFGGSGDDKGYSITTTSDGGILITGKTSSNDGDLKGKNKGGGDIFVMKLDREGKVLWKKTFDGSLDELGYSINTEDGGVLITGRTESNDGDFKGMNKGEDDIFVVKLDKDGNLLWKKTFGGSNWDVGLSITTTSDGGVLITGWTYSNNGNFKGMNKGPDDIFVIKLDKDGNLNTKGKKSKKK